MTAKKVFGVVAFFFVAITGCTGSERVPSAVAPDALAGHQYRSAEEREVGMGQNELVMGYSRLTFSLESEVAWQHSDVVEAGGYALATDGSMVLRSFLVNEIEVRYDVENDRVLWDDLWYERVLE